MKIRPCRIVLIVLLSGFFISPATIHANDPIEFQDAAGRSRVIDQPPQRVVSLVSSVSELLFRIGEIKADLSHTAEKVSTIPADQRRRIMRLMGRDRVMIPGDDSFQNEIIRRAGGIPPALGKTGSIVPVTLGEWQAFNPQVIYGCGWDREIAMKMLDQPGWREVDAVKNGRVLYFPCDLTFQLASRTGYFVSCLASRVYGEAFAAPPPLRLDGQLASRSMPMALPYLDGAEIVESWVNDYIHKTLLVHLNAPMAVSSTLEGFRERIAHVGNSYSPPEVWGLLHRIGLERSREYLVQRLEDRQISLFGLVDDCSCGVSGSRLTAEVERLFMDPAVAGFIEAAMAISDDYERGLVRPDRCDHRRWADTEPSGLQLFPAVDAGIENGI